MTHYQTPFNVVFILDSWLQSYGEANMMIPIQIYLLKCAVVSLLFSLLWIGVITWVCFACKSCVMVVSLMLKLICGIITGAPLLLMAVAGLSFYCFLWLEYSEIVCISYISNRLLICDLYTGIVHTGEPILFSDSFIVVCIGLLFVVLFLVLSNSMLAPITKSPVVIIDVPVNALVEPQDNVHGNDTVIRKSQSPFSLALTWGDVVAVMYLVSSNIVEVPRSIFNFSFAIFTVLHNVVSSLCNVCIYIFNNKVLLRACYITSIQLAACLVQYEKTMDILRIDWVFPFLYFMFVNAVSQVIMHILYIMLWVDDPLHVQPQKKVPIIKENHSIEHQCQILIEKYLCVLRVSLEPKYMLTIEKDDLNPVDKPIYDENMALLNEMGIILAFDLKNTNLYTISCR